MQWKEGRKIQVANSNSKHSSSLNFAVKTPQKKKYVCEVDTPEEKQSWMAYINRAVYERTSASSAPTVNQIPKEPTFETVSEKKASPSQDPVKVSSSQAVDFPDIPSRPDFSEFSPNTAPLHTVASTEIAMDDVESSDEEDEKVDLSVDLSQLDKIEKQLDAPSGKVELFISNSFCSL